MKTVIKKEMTFFLASSAELRKDRDLFGDFVQRLNYHYANRGLGFQLDKWEYFDSLNAFNDNRTQSEYNKHIKACDVFVCLFYTKAGKFTQEEFNIALGECHRRKLPLFVSMRDLEKGVTEEESLTQFKERLKELEYFWLSYGTNDKLHLDFVLWLDSYIFDGKSPIKVENGHVMLEGIKVADISGMSFAINNKDYQELEATLQKLDEDIEDARKNIRKYPDDPGFPATLSKKLVERNEKQQELERQQEAFLGTARHIAELKKKQVSKKLQQAIDSFEAGQLNEANKLLEELEHEGERLIGDFETTREQIHEHIEALRLQTQTVMAEAEKPIKERITRVAEIYAKADDWASRSAYDKEQYEQLLFDYAQFLYDYAHYNESVKIYLRQIVMQKDLYGENNANAATSYNNIGAVYKSQANYEKAEEYYFMALKIYEKVFGIGHPFTATSYNNIGAVYNETGDYDKALKYHSKALRIRKKILGEKDPSTAFSYNNIGVAYYKKGDYDKALKCHFQALQIRKDTLNPEHPDIAQSYNNIAAVCCVLGDYDKALDYYFEAIYIHEIILGAEHPYTAIGYNNLGAVYKEKGDYLSALQYFFKSLTILENVLGPEHPTTKSVQRNIDSLMKK